MTSFLHFRIVSMAVAVLATGVVAVQTAFFTESLESPVPAAIFPTQVSIPHWQALTEEPDPLHPRVQRYRQTADEEGVDLEVQFIPNLPEHYVRNPKLELRFLPRAHLPLDSGLRYYVSPRRIVVVNHHSTHPTDSTVTAASNGTGYWEADAMGHLSTIVTPDGRNAIVPREVAHRLYLDDLSLGRIGRWLFRREPLPDTRAVLIHLSTPASPGAHAALESAWAAWRTTGMPVFPPLTR